NCFLVLLRGLSFPFVKNYLSCAIPAGIFWKSLQSNVKGEKNQVSIKRKQAALSLLLMAAVLMGCKFSKTLNSNSPSSNTNKATSKTTTPPAKPNADGTIASGVGEEKEKPEAGKGNVQGKVFYNEQPVEGTEVKLCEEFNQYFGGCKG